MKGFSIISLALVASVVMCGGSFATGNTAIVLFLFVAFVPMLWIHGYMAGKNFEIQSPLRAKEIAAGQRLAAAPAPVQRPTRESMLKRQVAEELS
jgi:hypothetical protein